MLGSAGAVNIVRDFANAECSNNDGTADTITNVAPTGTVLAPGAATAISWTDNGGFRRNVTIQLSTDGGATFPTVIASNVPSTGSRAWTVPNTPTTQARVRESEHDFVAPAGVSAAAFNVQVSGEPVIVDGFEPPVVRRP